MAGVQHGRPCASRQMEVTISPSHDRQGLTHMCRFKANAPSKKPRSPSKAVVEITSYLGNVGCSYFVASTLQLDEIGFVPEITTFPLDVLNVLLTVPDPTSRAIAD